MALTGRVVSAEEARAWGLINEVVDDGKVVARAVEWARMIAGNSPVGVSLRSLSCVICRARCIFWSRMFSRIGCAFCPSVLRDKG